MLTEVKAYSSWQSAPTLLLDNTGRPETDLIQIRNIEGLDPVKASVNTSPRGAVDGANYLGSNVESRNIVLTIHPNPDWTNYTPASLRRLLYSYFMPKRAVKLEFYSDDIVPVEISGIVESIEGNPFSQDPEYIVSIICPDPYFTAITPVVVVGQSVRSGGEVEDITYNGSVETGIKVKVSQATDPVPTFIGVQIGDPEYSYFTVIAGVDSSKYFEMSSLEMQKFVQNISLTDGIINNLLSSVDEGSSWPVLQPGENHFSVITDDGVQDWELTYSERFGGL